MTPLPSNFKMLLAGIIVFSFIILVIASPEHHDDPIFWWMAITVLALSYLSIVLGSDSDQETKQLFIRLFFIGEAALIGCGADMTAKIITK